MAKQPNLESARIKVFGSGNGPIKRPLLDFIQQWLIESKVELDCAVIVDRGLVLAYFKPYGASAKLRIGVFWLPAPRHKYAPRSAVVYLDLNYVPTNVRTRLLSALEFFKRDMLCRNHAELYWKEL